MMSKLLYVLDLIGMSLSQFRLKFLNKQLLKENKEYIYERSIEYGFVLDILSESKSLKVLDCGTGSNSFGATLQHCGYLVTATDFKSGSYWSFFENRHIPVVDDDITNSKIKANSYDAAICISTIEHIPDYVNAFKGLCNAVKPGGIIIVTCPYTHNEYYNNVYKHPDSDKLSDNFKYIAQSFSDMEVNGFVNNNPVSILKRIYFKGWEGKFWRTGNRIDFPIKVDNKEEANGICLAFRKQ